MLIKCPECGKEVSDKAENCIGCGFPLSEVKNDELICPDFPEDLSIGSSLKLDKSMFHCEFKSSENNYYKLESLKDGRYVLNLHENGICLMKLAKNLLSIHKSQIISIEQLSKQEIIEKDKSVVGRAIVGAVIGAGVGAIIGGLSGVGSKKTKVGFNYLVIQFWDIETKAPQTLVLSSEKDLTTYSNTCNKQLLNK